MTRVKFGDVRALSAIAGIFCISLSLVSCAGGVSFSPAESNLQLCSEEGPYDLLTLSQNDRPSCDVAGAELVFPDGFEITAPEMAGSGESSITSSPNQYFATNFAIYGIVAAVRDGEGKITWFGNVDAVQKYHDEVGYDF